MDFNNLFSPGEAIGDAPVTRLVAAAGAVLFSLLILGLIGFITLEFFMDMIGRPIYFADLPEGIHGAAGSRSAPREQIYDELQSAEELVRQFQIVTPLDRSVVANDRPLTIICRWTAPQGQQADAPPLEPEVTVDGLLYPWKHWYGRNTWYAEVDLSPGRHEIAVAGSRVNVFVHDIVDRVTGGDSNDRAPSDWFTLRLHPDSGLATPEKCLACHAVRQRNDIIAMGNQYQELLPHGGGETCITCHPLVKFELQHAHLWEPLKQCDLCHAIHGTTVPEPGLLKQPKDKLCVQCHTPRGK